MYTYINVNSYVIHILDISNKLYLIWIIIYHHLLYSKYLYIILNLLPNSNPYVAFI